VFPDRGRLGRCLHRVQTPGFVLSFENPYSIHYSRALRFVGAARRVES